MKRCPECRRDYYDDSLAYCLDDGAVLVDGPSTLETEPVTAILPQVEEPTRRYERKTSGLAPSKTFRYKLALIVGVAAVLSISGWWLVSRSGSRAVPEGGPQLRSIAVLPFRNTSNNADMEYLSDGMAEMLISSLTAVPDLQVKSRSSVYRFKGQDIEPKAVGRELGVDGVVMGSLNQRGSDVVLYVELVDAATEKAIWSQTYDRPTGNIVGLQNELASDVAYNLRSRLSSQQSVARRYPQDPEAYRLYLQGRYFFNKYSEDGIRQGIEYFNKALEIDPNSALAYSGLADAYINLGVDFMPPKNAFPLAKTYALKASELDPDLPESHAASGAISFFYDWDWAAARRELETVKSLSPESTEPYACTLHYSDAVEDPSHAVNDIRAINDRHPTSLIISSEIGCASYYAHRFDAAAEESQKTIQMDAGYGPAYFNLGRALDQQKKYDEAITALTKGADLLDGNSHVVAELAYVYAVSGRPDKAAAARQQLTQIAARRFVDPYLWAIVESGSGNKNKALEDLEQAYAQRSTWMPWIKLEPKFDYLRSEPRFQTLIDRMKFDLGLKTN